MAEPFNDPKVTINRVYTRKGDDGTTGLVGGQRVPKEHARIEGYGTVDELNSVVGLCRVSIAEAAAGGAQQAGLRWLDGVLHRVQHELFNLGSILATRPEDVHPLQPRVTEADVSRLETEMDSVNHDLPTLRSFVLPGGSRLNAELHLARTVCRRAERMVVALGRVEPIDAVSVSYLNRLSDALFVLSRYASVLLGQPEILWDPNVGKSAPAAPRSSTD